VLRAGTSVGAQYREARRARSTAEFVNRLEGVLQDTEETMYWIQCVTKGNLLSGSPLPDLAAGADELAAIFVSCVRNAKGKDVAAKENAS